MPKFKIGDFIMHNDSSYRSKYYKITDIATFSYVVDIYDTLTNNTDRADCFGSFAAVDKDFTLYYQSNLTQIRRP